MTANGNGTDSSGAALRIDKWLFFARFFKSRSLAAALCAAGRVRVNRQPIRKAHHALRVGDVLTFPQGGRIRVVRVAGLGTRRGPAEEARLLYEDLMPTAPAPAPSEGQPAQRAPGAGRPTKADRRAIDRLNDF
ncbi:MAG TPA: RNA-binding S4 domain-containing protein [Alphaproteobacteria bacterium]